MSPKKFRRTRTIVDRGRQMAFAAKVTTVQLIVTLTFHAAVQLRISKHIASSESIELSNAMETLSRNLSGILLGVGLVTCALVFFLALWFSARMIGPLPRLSTGMKQISQGDYSARMKFRPGDVIEHLAMDFNQMAESLEKKYGATNPEQPSADPSKPLEPSSVA